MSPTRFCWPLVGRMAHSRQPATLAAVPLATLRCVAGLGFRRVSGLLHLSAPLPRRGRRQLLLFIGMSQSWQAWLSRRRKSRSAAWRRSSAHTSSKPMVREISAKSSAALGACALPVALMSGVNAAQGLSRGHKTGARMNRDLVADFGASIRRRQDRPGFAAFDDSDRSRARQSQRRFDAFPLRSPALRTKLISAPALAATSGSAQGVDPSRSPPARRCARDTRKSSTCALSAASHDFLPPIVDVDSPAFVLVRIAVPGVFLILDPDAAAAPARS